MRVKTFITDARWQKLCSKKLDEVLDDSNLARRALEAILADKTLSKELPKKFYIKTLRNAI